MKGEYVVSSDLERNSEIRYEKPAEEICGVNMGGQPKKTLHYTKETGNGGERRLIVDERGRVTLEMACPVSDFLSGEEQIEEEYQTHIDRMDASVDLSNLEDYEHDSAHHELDVVVAELEQGLQSQNQLL